MRKLLSEELPPQENKRRIRPQTHIMSQTLAQGTDEAHEFEGVRGNFREVFGTKGSRAEAI